MQMRPPGRDEGDLLGWTRLGSTDSKAIYEQALQELAMIVEVFSTQTRLFQSLSQCCFKKKIIKILETLQWCRGSQKPFREEHSWWVCSTPRLTLVCLEKPKRNFQKFASIRTDSYHSLGEVIKWSVSYSFHPFTSSAPTQGLSKCGFPTEDSYWLAIWCPRFEVRFRARLCPLLLWVCMANVTRPVNQLLLWCVLVW